MKSLDLEKESESESKGVPVNALVPRELRRRMKLFAAERDISYASAVRLAFHQFLEQSKTIALPEPELQQRLQTFNSLVSGIEKLSALVTKKK